MRNRWTLGLLLMAGCAATPTEKATLQVPAEPFAQARAPITKVSYAPASQDTQERVEIMRGKLCADNPGPKSTPYLIELVQGKQSAENPGTGLRLYATAIGSPDPEIFHVGYNQIFITEGLVRQCQTDGQLAAVLANEMGKIVSEREGATSDQARNPERPPPIYVPIGGPGSGRDLDPTFYNEMARQERLYPKQTKKLPPPNPQQVARGMLERGGFQRTELDAVQPILQNAERVHTWENQFKGNAKPGDWKAP
jgi:hypothetical protein